ncbi:glycosyltransferase family 8 protein [Macroventuria anomochaeta]|uniref:Glycosyltransferase family 8 protein n=1 Tax=Macroventuria anomochaeta TaxID=301207 RepID=A0ACB6RXE8_9PLEO|nr:glycosyltransferase family 8 protein [Macroventuria anomochaeta]KAF2625829.1 glycosyltransferase family 8 protein [Macroventuria anomochaeta]
MKRPRHFLVATLLLLGLVYFFTQYESMSLSVGPANSHTGPSTNTQHTHDLPKQHSSHEGDKSSPVPLLKDVTVSGKLPPTSSLLPSKSILNLPTSSETPLPAIESTSTPPTSFIDFDFQKDLTLNLPVNTFTSLSKQAPHNYNPNGPKSYVYATFFASRNPSIEDPYFLAINSLIYRILWSPRSKTSKHPFVVFVGDFVSSQQRLLLAGAGAIVRELAPLPWNPTDLGVLDRWKDLFAKLHMWNETEFDRILFLDADALPIAPIDDMFSLKKVRNCIESKMQLDDFLPGGELVCEPYIFAGVPHDPYSIFDADINVGSMVFTPNSKQHQRLLQNYLKFDKYDVKMAEQAFLNWQFGINSAYPPGMLEREYGAFFPDEKGEKGMKVVHEKIWAAQRGVWKEEWDNSWKEMLQFYGSEEFETVRRADGESAS